MLIEAEFECDLNSISIQAVLKIRTFLKGINVEQLKLREKVELIMKQKIV